MKRDLAKVAEIACLAHAENCPMSRAVGAHFDITRAAAQGLIKKSRAAGHKIPYTKPGGWDRSIPVHQLRLICTCGEEFPVERSVDLIRHCGNDHQRVPTVIERTPRQPTVEVAA